MNKREEQKEKRRQEILFHSLTLFVEKGYEGTKISDITAAVEMSSGLFFHYFSSKEEVFLELVKAGLQGTQMAMQHTFENAIDFFEATAKFIFAMLKENPFTAKIFVLMADVLRNPSVPQEAKELANQVNNIDASVGLIQQGQADGTIKEGDPLALSVAFWSAVQGISEEIALNPQYPCPDSQWVVDIVRKH